MMEEFRTSNDARMTSKVAELRVRDVLCHQDETSDTESPRSENKATEWTDEKHLFYLKSLEASFIRHYNKILRPHSSSNRNSSSHKMINFDKDRSMLKRTEHSDTLISKPWIERVRPARRGKVMSLSSFDAMDTDYEIVSREMSDQNFVQVMPECDNCNVKRQRIDSGSATRSSGDQMVPFWKHYPTVENASVRRETRKD